MQANAQQDRLGPSSNQALWGGLLFSLLFTGLIALAGARLDAVRLLPDQGASWYLWQLPEPTWLTRTTAWLGYAAHQVGLWGLIYYAQTRVGRYTQGLHRVNVWALALNAAFIVLHFVQSHIWYDGLAQDVTIWSSQFSVILMLVFILAMENTRRGLFFGRKAPLSKQVVGFFRKYHGYLFAWASVYTFWYHPTISTLGHLIGFFYMFSLLLQGSLFFTRAHLNRYWTVALELMVLVHGTLVAVGQGNGIWPMFFFGFAGIFVITQVWGLGWPRWAEWGSVALWLGGALFFYNGRFAEMNEIIRIPFIEYILVFLLTWLFAGTAWLIQRLAPTPGDGRLPAASGD